jgi:signal peptidase I
VSFLQLGYVEPNLFDPIQVVNSLKNTGFCKMQKQENWLIELIKTVAYALVLVVGVHTAFYKPFNIPSGSMVPSLLIGDYIFVCKFSYGFSRYSIPFSPDLFEGRILARDLKRGDVAVFRYPRDLSEDWVKRVIGLPGDLIKVEKGIVYINNEPVKLKKVQENYSWTSERGKSFVGDLYTEKLPNGVEHYILKSDPFGEGRLDDFPERQVPEGYYFMMGDNRDHSNDSRNLNDVGFIAYEYFIGRADLIFFSTQLPTEPGSGWWSFWKWPTSTRYSRIIRLIQ